MKNKGILLTLLVFVASLFSAAATLAAQQEDMKSQQQKSQADQQKQDRNLFSANWLIGNKVLNQQGQDLGEITNIILDQETGNAAFVTVSSGGFLNMGEDRSFVPYKALQIREDQIILNIDKEKLSQSPKMEQGLTPEEFDRRSSEFFGVSPVWGDSNFDWYDTEFEKDQDRIIEDKGQ